MNRLLYQIMKSTLDFCGSMLQKSCVAKSFTERRQNDTGRSHGIFQERGGLGCKESHKEITGLPRHNRHEPHRHPENGNVIAFRRSDTPAHGFLSIFGSDTPASVQDNRNRHRAERQISTANRPKTSSVAGTRRCFTSVKVIAECP